jgi:hypothetical protein
MHGTTIKTMSSIFNKMWDAKPYLQFGQRLSRGLQLEQMLCPFKHWVIGEAIMSKQTGHSRRLARLLVKFGLNFRGVEFTCFAAIVYAVYNLLLYK